LPFRADEQQVLTFHVGALQLAASAEAVAEVFRRTKITRVPLGPPGLIGVVSLRGTVVPVVSLARLLGQDDAPITAQSRILLLQRAEPIGIALDSVGTLARVKMPEMQDDDPQASTPLLVWEEGELRVLALDELIERTFAGLVRRGSQALTPVGGAQPERQAAMDEILLLAFELAGQSYALPLADVAELIAVPPKLTSVTQADEMMLGVTSLRQRLLPVASLRLLLGLDGPATDDRHARIVVTRIGGARIGFLVDRVKAIVRTSAAFVDPVPSILNRGPGEAHIQSICRLPETGNLVSILSAAHLFKDDTIMRILAEADDTEVETRGETDPIALEQILVFQLGEEDYGLPAEVIGEVLNMPDVLTRVPRAPAFVEGVMHHRGKVLTMIDQRSRFGVEGERSGKRRRVIVTELNERPIGFVVDTVSEILSLPAHHVRNAPGLTDGEGKPLFHRIATLEQDNRTILLIEPHELLNRVERDLLKAFCTTDEGAVAS
jgi:purine-binding chemotaxis protein CheW